MAVQGRPLVEELERRIDEILERRPGGLKKTVSHPLAVTEENARRVFGLSLWNLFRTLATKFGYEVPEEPPEEPPQR